MKNGSFAKFAQRSKSAHTIAPQESELMRSILVSRGATVEDLAKTMETSEGMVRKLASRLSSITPPYVQSTTIFERRVVRGEERSVCLKRYFLGEDFAHWPSAGLFLLEAKFLVEKHREKLEYQCRTASQTIPVDNNRRILIPAFREHLKKHHAYTDDLFDRDWNQLLQMKYIIDQGENFGITIRVDDDEQFFLLSHRYHT